MSVGAAINARLANMTSAEGRVYPLIMPQDSALPAITYQVISTSQTHAMRGDVPIRRERVQVNSWGRTYAEVHNLAGLVSQQLSRYKGTAGGLTILDVLKDNEFDDYESETRRVIQDFTFIVAE